MNWILIKGADLHSTTVANRVAKELNVEKVQFVSDDYGSLSVYVDGRFAYSCYKVAPFTWRVPVHALADELARQAD